MFDDACRRMERNTGRGKQNRIKVYKMKNYLLLIIFLLATVSVSAQKKVAVWETQCHDAGVSNLKKIMVRGDLEEAVDNTQGYIKYDRAMFDAIMAEHNFQRSGAVKDEDVRRMGEMAGVQYVIVPEVSTEDNYFYILVRMLDVETGQSRTAQELCSTDPPAIMQACTKLSDRLLGKSSGSGNNTSNNSSAGNYSTNRGAASLHFSVNGVNFEMIKVEAGSFIMGCTSEQGGDCFDWEKPSHRVTITQDYYIGKFEVTQELYQAVMGTNPSCWKEYNRPVENVSWNDAMEFCAELSRLTGRQFTLPTEAEWEYAARGGKKSTSAKYSGSSSVNNVAWYDGNSGSQTHPVGKLRPNELGIYDMSGNVWEWCYDWYGSYSSASQTDPMGPSSGSYRVLRGGSWGNNAGCCRVSNRGNLSPDRRIYRNGFRVVLH